ncbi:permease-like cell division protein FtsX [Thermoanaerobacterium thermosaccharolyticum]|jgi:cell division transport system permease protein|uniref:permease-like cell division protein FtsX n=1 Tax=Thermoanaerobacterium thermosaccharolyticum TaxID=1517 RepID=UPI00123BB5A8|nr:permease-like cell division protein FtsX [Thermoanaerobacterium thermosaccharolyticum]KAA5808464.1 ABC transporter permease [Thermoanaerobacterium thermosaccharolyticum]MBE0068401.1 ABC transporter permease [Thermoanaerobacterium thermosaccharolyticum]MBE0228406.1 ABC transporter permease [Thermoanaerobacterium thermosaccharolyticum]MCP2239387.1 cell division transport system permease protein [Thermoanaerobacterium thermosaccharolyticum]
MKLNTAFYYIREGLTNVKRNRAMTVASITSVTAALLILGLFLIIILNVDSMANQVESQLELKAFINDSYDMSKVTKVGDEIKEINGVKSITFESKKDALNNFKKQLGDKSYLVNGLENDNPMPQSFIVKVTDANMMKQVSEEIKKIDGVTQVSYGQDVVDKLLGIIKIIRIVGLCVILILFIISVVIISNTIKLGVFARRREINIMKYIGATDWFIRWPFLVEGIVLGLVGSILAIVILGLIYGYAADLVNNKLIIFTLLPVGNVLRESLMYFLAMGSLIGALGSGISIKRFLNV